MATAVPASLAGAPLQRPPLLMRVYRIRIEEYIISYNLQPLFCGTFSNGFFTADFTDGRAGVPDPRLHSSALP
jgi:hypothetical protein